LATVAAHAQKRTHREHGLSALIVVSDVGNNRNHVPSFRNVVFPDPDAPTTTVSVMLFLLRVTGLIDDEDCCSVVLVTAWWLLLTVGKCASKLGQRPPWNNSTISRKLLPLANHLINHFPFLNMYQCRLVVSCLHRIDDSPFRIMYAAKS
jgi:hypothetical protein